MLNIFATTVHIYKLYKMHKVLCSTNASLTYYSYVAAQLLHEPDYMHFADPTDTGVAYGVI